MYMQLTASLDSAQSTNYNTGHLIVISAHKHAHYIQATLPFLMDANEFLSVGFEH